MLNRQFRVTGFFTLYVFAVAAIAGVVIPARKTVQAAPALEGHTHEQRHTPSANRTEHTQPTLAGQYAFATLAEIVELLENDPTTDWLMVDLESLRQHLIDMDRVTLSSSVESTAVDDGMQFSVTGSDAATIASIQRMTQAHAAMQSTAVKPEAPGRANPPSWRYGVQLTGNGAVLTVTTDDTHAIQRIRGLGFIGIVVSGSHHQAHHWALANGQNPHEH